MNAPEWLTERHRALLRLRARHLQLDPRLRTRFDESDLVQETLLRAHAHREQCRGETDGERLAWLQVILDRVALDHLDKAHAQKADVDRERALQDVVAGSSAQLQAFLATRDPSPSSQAERNEQLLLLAEAVDRLPAEWRDVVIARDFVGTPLADIATEMGKSERAVAGLLHRGRQRLRELLTDRKELSDDVREQEL